MIEKMQFLSITGPKADFDRVVDTYLSKYEMHLENALTEVKNAQGIAPFTEENPYKQEIGQIRSILKDYGNVITGEKTAEPKAVSLEEAVSIVRETTETLSSCMEEKNGLKEQLARMDASYRKIVPFIGLNYDIEKILQFDNVKYSFGRMPVEYYKKLQDYVYDSLDALILECTRDREFVYVLYFVPKREEDKVDAVFASMYFEKIFIPDEYKGTPEQAINQLHQQMKDCQEKIFAIDVKIAEVLETRAPEILGASERLERYATTFDVRKYAACTKHDIHTFYIICGWMSQRDAEAFRRNAPSEPPSNRRPWCLHALLPGRAARS